MKPSIFKEVWKRPSGKIVVSILFTLYFCAIFSQFLSPYLPSDQNLEKSYHPPTAIIWKNGMLQVQTYENLNPSEANYQPIEGKTIPLKLFTEGAEYKFLGVFPTNLHLFGLDTSSSNNRVYLLGSDQTGRDIFTRLLYGAQISLSIGLIGIAITMSMGFFIGGLSGYFSGIFDFLAMRSVEFLMAIPGLYLLLCLRFALADHFNSAQMYLVIVIILSCIGWAGTARVIRGMSLSIRTRQYVLASEAMGQSTSKILIKHLLPNLSSYLIVAATLSIPGYILGEAALSFLGLGITEPTPSWGLMLSQAQEMKIFMLGFWWMLLPGFCIFLTVLSFNLLGDILRDIVDPKFRLNQTNQRS